MRQAANTSLLALALGLAAAPARAEACTCVGPIATCGALASAAAVFEATVESITPGEPEVDPALPATVSVGTNKVSLRDVRSWRGVSSDTLFTPSYAASCGYEFQRGARYLVVADRLANGRLGVRRCGLTRPIADARGIIDYLGAAGSSTKPPIRVWGSVERAARWIDFAREFTGVHGAQVTFEGATRRAVVTSADGRYVVDGLPPGRYSVSVAIPADMKALGRVEPATIDLGAAPGAACLEVAGHLSSQLSASVMHP